MIGRSAQSHATRRSVSAGTCIGTIRALCAAHGHELLGLGVVRPIVRPGLPARLAWHFRTDRGRFYMIESDGRAAMFDVTNDAQIGDIQPTR